MFFLSLFLVTKHNDFSHLQVSPKKCNYFFIRINITKNGKVPQNDFYYISRVQQDATNFDFRKRHYEMKRAKEELEYQMKTVSLNIFGFHFITHSSCRARGISVANP